MSDSDFTIPISHTQESNREFGDNYGYKILKSGDLLWKRYYIVRELGRGGFATTYLAIDRHSKTKTKCVVKQLQPRLNSPTVWANAKERLATEAAVLQWLGNHDRIPQLLAHFEEERQFYLVLEYVEGEELEQEVQRQVLTEFQVVKFLNEILKILNFVHQQGVIHRDIKPSNLIRRKNDGKFALIDFGAVKEIGTLSFDSHRKPIETQIIGTPGYMPLEQNNGKPIYSSDLYALGKTAIFALTGRSPVEWETTETSDAPRWYDELAIGRALVKIIERMTAAKAERYHSASEVLQDLKPMLAVGKIVAKRYYIEEYLGNNGKIYSYAVRSLQPNNGTPYCLKVLRFQTMNAASLKSAIAQIERELANLARLKNQSQVPQIIEYLTDDKNLYLVQEYTEGETLEQIIESQKTLSEAEVIDLVIDAAEVLVQIHKQDIIHGNINPASAIERSRDGKLLFVDFGSIIEATTSSPSSSRIAPWENDTRLELESDDKTSNRTTLPLSIHDDFKFNSEPNSRTDEQAKHSSPQSDRIVAVDSHDSSHSPQSLAPTVAIEQTDYMAPEQIAGNKIFASDIYSLGMVAIHLLTGISPPNLPKNPRTGEILWQKHLKIDSKLAKILNKMVCLDKRKRYHSAGKLLRDLYKIKQRSPLNSWLRYLLIFAALSGIVWFGLVQWAQRVAILEFYKGDIKLEANRYREAIEYYDNGLNKLPKTRGIVRNFEQVWLKKARALNQLNSYERVIDTCGNALRYYQSHRLWNCKALALDSLKRYDEALDAYNSALALNEESPWLWNNRGEVYAQMGDVEAASADFQQAIELDAAKSFVPWNNLGKLHYQQRNYQRAIEAYQQALLVKKDYLPALIGLGNAYKNQLQYSDALKAYNQAIEYDSNSYEAWYGKGLVEESLQQYREARKAYQTAFSLKPDWETVIKALQRVERKIGN